MNPALLRIFWASASTHGVVNPISVIGNVGVDTGQLGAGARNSPGHQSYQGALAVLEQNRNISSSIIRSTTKLDYDTLFKTSGPPESPWQESLPPSAKPATSSISNAWFFFWQLDEHKGNKGTLLGCSQVPRPSCELGNLTRYCVYIGKMSIKGNNENSTDFKAFNVTFPTHQHRGKHLCKSSPSCCCCQTTLGICCCLSPEENILKWEKYH